ncbi:class I SAM-dependent methyltransferase [Patescibacteria group bacterium]|nr:class I SAM-dependent methyltransferase [Patescibacteria group bacterium]
MLNNYNQLAKEYSKTDLKPDKYLSILPTVLQAVGDLSGKTVLDLGCGSGFFSRAFADAGAKDVLGIDSSLVQIDLAKQEPRLNVKYLVEDVFKTPLPRGGCCLCTVSHQLSFFKD